MNAERLLVHYERIAEAPDAVGRLRRFILDLAVRGKLVAQDPEDEPASELLKRVVQERERLVKGREVRRSRVENPVMIDAPFDLPPSWAWAALGTLFSYDAGTKREPGKLDPSFWLLELEDIEKDTGRVLARLTVAERDSQSTKSEFRPGDILYGKLRPYLNKVTVANERGYSTTEIVALRPFASLCSQYCALAFRRPDFVDYVTRLGQGTKMPRLRTEDAVAAAFPLPPLAEQHRIVDKVDELMALCDRLDAARVEREVSRDRLATASFARLNAPDPDTFADDARFALDALPALAARPDQIKELRRTIMNLAVRGELVLQDPGDEAAAALVGRIHAAASNLPPKAGRRTAGSKHDRDSAPDRPIRVPRSWSWLTAEQLAQAGNVITYGILKPVWTSEGVPTVRVTEMKTGTIDVAALPKCDPSRADQFTRTTLSEGDLLISKDGTIGKTAFVPAELEGGNITQHMLRFAITPEVNRQFVRLIIDSPPYQAWMAGETKGVALQGVNVGDFRRMPIPIPPLAEQDRIVAKVDELMALCDQLEASLGAADTTRRRLLDALLKEALAPVRIGEFEMA
jgi:type I restriction enzyme S subunit